MMSILTKTIVSPRPQTEGGSPHARKAEDTVQGRDLGEVAERCRAERPSSSAGEPSSVEPVEMALSVVADNQHAWRLRDGAKLRLVRRAILRVLAPFADRQDLLDGHLSVAVNMLADEVVRLRARVNELESGANDSDGNR